MYVYVHICRRTWIYLRSTCLSVKCCMRTQWTGRLTHRALRYHAYHLMRVGASFTSAQCLVHLADFSMFLFGSCYLLIVTTSEFKSRGSGETLAIWISRFLPLWNGIVWHGIFCIIVLCHCIMFIIIHIIIIIGYVGFKLFTKSWKGFPSFDCPENGWFIM